MDRASQLLASLGFPGDETMGHLWGTNHVKVFLLGISVSRHIYIRHIFFKNHQEEQMKRTDWGDLQPMNISPSYVVPRGGSMGSTTQRPPAPVMDVEPC